MTNLKILYITHQHWNLVLWGRNKSENYFNLMQLKELNFIFSCQIFWLNILNLRAFWAFEKVDIDCECFQGFRGVHSFVMQFYLQSVNIAGFFSNMYNKCTKCGVSLRFLQPSFLNIEKKKTMYPVNPCKHLQSISTFSKVPQTDSWYVATKLKLWW